MSFADDFAKNANIYNHALRHYLANDFTYIELGDGDELWEHLSFRPILEAHGATFKILSQFYTLGRYYKIWGNHDIIWRKQNSVKKHLYSFFDKKLGELQPLFPGIQPTEAIVLEHKQTAQQLFLTHGHQAEYMNAVGWKIHRFLVRVLWKPLQVWGIADPTSPARNYLELRKVERRIKKWIVTHNDIVTITGHTHRPRFPEPDDIPYFNDGSCVHPRSITGLEIENDCITLIKWHITTTKDGALHVDRVILEGPKRLALYGKSATL